jgi:hypothetical protein
MDPLIYFFVEEFIFPDAGGVTGQRMVDCPGCRAALEIAEGDIVDNANYRCPRCGVLFQVDWMADTVVEVTPEE